MHGVLMWCIHYLSGVECVCLDLCLLITSEQLDMSMSHDDHNTRFDKVED